MCCFLLVFLFLHWNIHSYLCFLTTAFDFCQFAARRKHLSRGCNEVSSMTVWNRSSSSLVICKYLSLFEEGVEKDFFSLWILKKKIRGQTERSDCGLKSTSTLVATVSIFSIVLVRPRFYCPYQARPWAAFVCPCPVTFRGHMAVKQIRIQQPRCINLGLLLFYCFLSSKVAVYHSSFQNYFFVRNKFWRRKLSEPNK